LLRQGDLLAHMGEDRFGIVIGVTDASQVEAVCRRIDATLVDVPVPHRANQISPTIRTPGQGQINADAELAELLAQYAPGQSRRAG
jgi:GGDEF domain-containing protein